MPFCSGIRRTLLAGLLLALAAWPAWGQAAKGKRYAVLIGINAYEHPRLRKLRYAENDAAQLARLLRRAGYEVVLLTGAEGARNARQQPTRANIEARLDEVLRRCRRGDTVLVAFAGHGLQFAGKTDAYLCPADARPFGDETGSLVSLEGIYARLDKSFASAKLLLLDACRDDPALKRGARGLSGDGLSGPPSGVAVLFSCRAGQLAFEDDKLRHGVFFHFVLEGLKGKAANEDDEVTWARLAEYVSRQVNRQTPKLIGDGARQTPHEVKNWPGEPTVLLLMPGGAGALERGKAHLERKEYDEAIRALTKAIARQPSEAAYRLRGNAHAGKGEHARASADYTEAIRLDPRSAASFNRGVVRTRTGDYAGASADLTRAIALAPADAGAYHARGLVRALQEDYPRAIADFTRAIDLSPRYADAYRSRGLAYRALGNETRAAQDFAADRLLSGKP
jgi:tetratricopeptide (TPR) repeat protein